MDWNAEKKRKNCHFNLPPSPASPFSLHLALHPHISSHSLHSPPISPSPPLSQFDSKLDQTSPSLTNEGRQAGRQAGREVVSWGYICLHAAGRKTRTKYLQIFASIFSPPYSFSTQARGDPISISLPSGTTRPRTQLYIREPAREPGRLAKKIVT